ncbi:MAG: NUDIX hydrolase [Chloroflexota bacterium]
MSVPNDTVDGASHPRRHFAVATFVVSGEKVLLLFHRKLAMWLPPGGHVEPSELPDEAAVREVAEETGVSIVLLGARGLDMAYPRQLVRPEGLQVEHIDAEHEHIDFVYFAVPTGGEVTPPVRSAEAECNRAGWYTLVEMAALGANAEIQAWAAKAIRTVAERGDWIAKDAK